MTERLREIAEAMAGGMPVAREDLTLGEWKALGRIRAAIEAGVL